MVKLLIFDMDGTIIDTDEVLFQTWKELFLLYKPKDFVINREEVITYSGPPIEESIAKAFPEGDFNFILKEYRKRTKKYYDIYMKLFPNVKEVLSKLNQEGYIFSIATSKNKEMALKSLEKYGIREYFKIILTSDDNFLPKPNPQMIDYIVEKLNISKNNVVMIGDTKYDYYAAKNAGIKSILFNGSPRNYTEDLKPIAIVNNYLDLYKIVKKL